MNTMLPLSGSRIVIAAAAMLILVSGVQSARGDALPAGGRITAGAGAIVQNGNLMTVTQDSDRMITQWQSFNIGADARVQFIQPGSSSVGPNLIWHFWALPRFV